MLGFSISPPVFFLGGGGVSWMSRWKLASKVRISGWNMVKQPQYIPFISRWNNPFTNHLLTSWDILGEIVANPFPTKTWCPETEDGLYTWRISKVTPGRWKQQSNLTSTKTNETRLHNYLVAEPTHLKSISQIGSFPQVGVKITNIWNHHLEKEVHQMLHSLKLTASLPWK